MRTRSWLLIGCAVAIAVLVWVGPPLWESKVTLARYRPPPPELGTWPVEAQQRIRRADTAAKSFGHARRGLAELARLYQANGFYDEALACYTGLRRVEPKNAQWFHLPAFILAGQGHLEDAQVHLGRAAELAPEYLPAQVRAADVLLKTNRLAEAERIYEDVLARFGEQPYALLGLARAAISRGEWKQAEALLHRAIAVDGNFVGGLSLLATVFEHLGRKEEATRLIHRVNRREFVELRDPWVESLMDDCYDPHLLSVAAGTAIFRQDAAMAKRWLERAAALATNPAPYLRQLGQVGYLTRNYTEAGNHLAKAVALAPTDAEAWTVWVNVLLAAGNRTEAYRKLSDGLSHCPESGALRYIHGHLLNEDGQVQRAIAELRAAKRYRASQADVYIELAKAYFKVGDIEAGVAEMKGVLAVQPDHPKALVVLARHAIDQGDVAAAREWIRRLRLQPRVESDDTELVLRAFQEQFGGAP